MEDQVKQDIMDALYWDNRIISSDIKVEINKTEAILSGEVSSHAERRSAEIIARITPGVQRLKNKLVIRQQISPVPSDSEIHSIITQIYLWNQLIDHTKIHIKVDKGIVTLKGTVTSLWEKARAEDLIDDIIGVMEVIDELAVVPTESHTDEQIAKRIIGALERNILIEVDSINVRVEHGRVLLSGSVRSNYARERAGDIALVTAGVTFVENLIEANTAGGEYSS